MTAAVASRRFEIAMVPNLAADFVVREFGITRIDIESARRHRHLVTGRALIVWAIRTYGNPWWSYPQIGRWMGGRDHTTIIHLERKARGLIETDPAFAELCRRFELELGVPQGEAA